MKKVLIIWSIALVVGVTGSLWISSQIDALSHQVDVQSVQGGDDNTDFQLQPSDVVLQSHHVWIQADDIDLQSAAGSRVFQSSGVNIQ